MGVSYYATAVIGVRVPKDKMYVEVSPVSCSCRREWGGPAKFCPNCGKEVKRAVTATAPGFDAGKMTYTRDGCVFQVFRGCDLDGDYFIGRGVSAGPHNGGPYQKLCNVPLFSAQEQMVLDYLGPVYLWAVMEAS